MNPIDVSQLISSRVTSIYWQYPILHKGRHNFSSALVATVTLDKMFLWTFVFDNLLEEAIEE